MSEARCRLPDGGHVVFDLSGKQGAPAILLLRPLGGARVLWGEFRRVLDARLRTIAFDPRGVGASNAARVPTTTRGMAADALALLDHLRVERVHVFGISLGGMVASHLAVDRPARVRRLVLASTLARGVDVGGGVTRGLAFAESFFHPARTAESTLVRRVLSDAFRRRHPHRTAHLAALARSVPASRKELLLLASAAAMHDARRALRSLRAPTLLLYGDRDPLVTAAARDEMRRALPTAHLEVMQGGHDLTLEAPIQTAERVVRFVLEGT